MILWATFIVTPTMVFRSSLRKTMPGPPLRGDALLGPSL
jgi:hypothetical protein